MCNYEIILVFVEKATDGIILMACSVLKEILMDKNSKSEKRNWASTFNKRICKVLSKLKHCIYEEEANVAR